MSSYSSDLTVVSSVFRGENKYVPKQLYSSEPHIVQKYMVKTLTEVNDKSNKSNQIITIPLKAEDYENHELICPFVKFTIPKILMKNAGDFYKYCSLPAVNLFNSINLVVDGRVYEHLNPLSLEVALKKYLQSNFESFAEKWLGGVNGPNQQFSYAEHLDCIGSVIKPDIECLVPIPVSIFRNEKLFPISLAKESPISIQITMNPISKILSCCKMSNTSSETVNNLEVFSTYSCFNKVIFNNLPYVNPDILESAYIAEDKPLIFNTKEIKSKTDMSITTLNDPITEYFGIISNNSFNNHVFMGKNNEDCRANFWASLFTNKKDGLSENHCIKLSKKCFLSGDNVKTSNAYQIIDTDDPKKMILRYTLLVNVFNDTLIESDIPFSDFPDDLLLNLNTWSYINDSCTLPRPEHFSFVHFKIKPYDINDTRYIEDSTSYNGVMKLLHNGLFTFENGDKKYSFIAIDNMKKSRFINNEMYDILPCIPIESINFNANIFISYKHARINYPYHTFYDLDGKHPIKIKEYTKQKKSENHNFNIEHMELERGFFLNKYVKYPFGKFQLHKLIELSKNGIGTNGFEANNNNTCISPEIGEIELRYDNKTTQASYILSLYNYTLQFSFIQVLLRFLKFKPNAKTIDQYLSQLNTSEARILAEDVFLNELYENGVFANCFKMPEDLDDSEINLGHFKREKKIQKRKLDDNDENSIIKRTINNSSRY